MKIKQILLLLIFSLSILGAETSGVSTTTTAKTSKVAYLPNENIVATFSGMSGDAKDWIAIYPAGSSTEWKNMIQWDWTGGVSSGTKTFSPLPVGHYNVRVFFKNSYNVEAEYTFEVKDAATVTTNKSSYTLNENIVATFDNMMGDEKDWIAIYPSGSSNAWANVIQWDWTGGVASGPKTFTPLPVGHYDVRVFFKNSYKVEAKYTFEVKDAVVGATVTTNKESYTPNENIVATFDNMMGDEKDWIAIYPAGSTTAWENMIQWDWTGGGISGSKSFTPLPAGDYEVRVFFKNSYTIAAQHAFKVKSDVVLGSGSLILNEYDAVSSTKFLKNGGTDSHFGRIQGNGSSWIELVVTGEHVDIRGKKLIVKQSGKPDFKATIPYLTQLGHLRRGTILTISYEPTDMSYAPFAPNGDDWVLNINVNDLLAKQGVFETSASDLSVEIFDEALNSYLLFPSGEHSAAVSIDDSEVFKLKKNPQAGIAANDAAYGDDNNQKSYSTFGEPNRWGANGEHTQNFNALRANQDLTEVGGIVVSNIPVLNEVEDAESILYLPQNNALWIADDDAHKVFEMDFTNHSLRSSYDDVQLGTFAATIEDACDRGNDVGACDIESVAYNSDDDNFYIFVGKSSSQSAIFRLTRANQNASFELADYIDLNGKEYADALFINGEMIVAKNRNLYLYDYATNHRGAKVFRSPDGKVFGMAYANGILWLTTSTFKLIKVNWATKTVEAIYDMPKNGVYDPRGIEVINNKLYILEGMNTVGANQVLAPLGHALKNSIHIYNIP